MDRSPRQQTSLSPRSPSLAWDKSHCQQTPLSPRSPSSAWTGLIASRLLSPHARPPPHGTCLITSRLPSPRARPPPHGQTSSPADSPLHRAAQSVSVRESVTESVYQPLSPRPPSTAWDRSHRQQTLLFPRSPSPAWTGLIASRLLSPHTPPPPHGQVSPPADSPRAKDLTCLRECPINRDPCPRNGLD